MNMFFPNKKTTIILVFPCMIIGCVSPASYTKPITKFQEASTNVIESARTEYVSSNKTQMESFLINRVSDKDKITIDDLNSSNVYLFNSDQLVARMRALDALSKHAENLLALCSSDSPEKAKSSAKDLDESIISLSESLNNIPNSKFKEEASQLANAAGEVIKLVNENKINKALDRSIISSEDEVQNIIKILKDEMNVIYQRKKSIIHNYRVNSTTSYNTQITSGKIDPEKINKSIDNIKKYELEWSGLSLTLSVQSNLDTMSQAYKELVDYAKSPKNPQDISSLNEAIDAYLSRSKLIKDNLYYLKDRVGD